MAPPRCRYCSIIRKHSPRYRAKVARHALDTSFPRCDVHWRFVCERCGKARHFHAIAFCPWKRAFYCLGCAAEHPADSRRFWEWAYSYRLVCPWCDKGHATLDRLEFERRHPWQRWPAWSRARRGMTDSEEIPERWAFRVAPMEGITDADVAKGWDDVAAWWVSRYTAKGDINREWVIDPALLDILGDVSGRRILDAGCGTGYLARILAKAGASVDGVDVSAKQLEASTKDQEGERLDIRYRQGDLADLSSFRGGTFEIAVSNIVLQDVRRLAEAVKGVQIEADVLHLLGRVDAVAGDFAWDTRDEHCRDGNAGRVPITTGAPHVRLVDLAIAEGIS